MDTIHAHYVMTECLCLVAEGLVTAARVGDLLREVGAVNPDLTADQTVDLFGCQVGVDGPNLAE